MVCVTNNDEHIRQSSCRILWCLTGWKTNIFVSRTSQKYADVQYGRQMYSPLSQLLLS